jgi:hypothetical protein
MISSSSRCAFAWLLDAASDGSADEVDELDDEEVRLMAMSLGTLAELSVADDRLRSAGLATTWMSE